METSKVILVAWVSLSGLVGNAARAAMYTIIDLGTLGGRSSIGYAINEVGQVAGFSLTADGRQRGFLYSSGSMINLGYVGQDVPGYVTPTGINERGEVSGHYYTTSSHGFVYSGGVMQDLGNLGGDHVVASGINDHGDVSGYSRTADGDTRAFLYSGGVMRDLGTLGSSSWANDVNNSGQVTGYSLNFGDGARAFLYSDGEMRSLVDVLSHGIAINASGQIAGNYYLPDGRTHAFLYTAGAMHDLGTIGLDWPGRGSYSYGLNDLGQVTGIYWAADNQKHAFLYSDGVMRDLNELIAPNSGWARLVEANAINNKGWITGYGFTTSGEAHAFIMKPIPEPDTIALLAVSGLAAAWRGRRRGFPGSAAPGRSLPCPTR